MEVFAAESVFYFENNKEAHDQVIEKNLIHTFWVKHSDTVIKDYQSSLN